jgi:hypothetical protein
MTVLQDLIEHTLNNIQEHPLHGAIVSLLLVTFAGILEFFGDIGGVDRLLKNSAYIVAIISGVITIYYTLKNKGKK